MIPPDMARSDGDRAGGPVPHEVAADEDELGRVRSTGSSSRSCTRSRLDGSGAARPGAITRSSLARRARTQNARGVVVHAAL